MMSWGSESPLGMIYGKDRIFTKLIGAEGSRYNEKADLLRAVI